MAGIAFETVSAALQPAENLSIRQDSRTVDPMDPDDAAALVAYLYQLLDRLRFSRRSQGTLRTLKGMEQFANVVADCQMELWRTGPPLEGCLHQPSCHR